MMRFHSVIFLSTNKAVQGHLARSRGGCHENLSRRGLPIPFLPFNPLATLVVTLGVDGTGTHGQLSHECQSTCLSNSWLIHVQSMTRSGPAPVNSINTRAPRARETQFCRSGSARLACQEPSK